MINTRAVILIQLVIAVMMLSIYTVLSNALGCGAAIGCSSTGSYAIVYTFSTIIPGPTDYILYKRFESF